jgi:hypothetical protein
MRSGEAGSEARCSHARPETVAMISETVVMISEAVEPMPESITIGVGVAVSEPDVDARGAIA